MNQNENNLNLENPPIGNENDRNEEALPNDPARIFDNKINQRRFTLSFIIILLISLIEYVVSIFIYVSPETYSISLWPVVNKRQYYRMISHYFIHYGIFHLFIDLIILHYLLKGVEKTIGTMYTLCYIIHSMVLCSVIYLIFMFVLKYFFRIFDYNMNINFNSEIGLSPLGFSLHTFYFLFKHNKEKNISVLTTFEFNGGYSPLFFLLFVYFLTPNRSFFGHLSGIISAIIIKEFSSKYIFPKKKWVQDMEEIIGCFKSEYFYLNIINKNEGFNNSLDELLTFKENQDNNLNEIITE